MSYELKCNIEQVLYTPPPKYMVKFTFPKPWWKPKFLHDREVAKIIKEIKEIQEEFGE